MTIDYSPKNDEHKKRRAKVSASYVNGAIGECCKNHVNNYKATLEPRLARARKDRDENRELKSKVESKNNKIIRLQELTKRLRQSDDLADKILDLLEEEGLLENDKVKKLIKERNFIDFTI